MKDRRKKSRRGCNLEAVRRQKLRVSADAEAEAEADAKAGAEGASLAGGDSDSDYEPCAEEQPPSPRLCASELEAESAEPGQMRAARREAAAKRGGAAELRRLDGLAEGKRRSRRPWLSVQAIGRSAAFSEWVEGHLESKVTWM